MGKELLTAKHAVLNLGTIFLYIYIYIFSNSKDYKFTYPKILYLFFPSMSLFA